MPLPSSPSRVFTWHSPGRRPVAWRAATRWGLAMARPQPGRSGSWICVGVVARAEGLEERAERTPLWSRPVTPVDLVFEVGVSSSVLFLFACPWLLFVPPAPALASRSSLL